MPGVSEPGRAVFFDRDGVLNEPIVTDGKPFSPMKASELSISEGAPAACSALRSAGFVLVVVTNQPEVARGNLSLADLDEMHARLRETLGIDLVVVCPHDDGDGCSCRKPRPGMVTKAAQDLGIDLDGSWLVGDRWKDIEAGAAAGCRTIFIDRGYDERAPLGHDHSVATVGEAADLILARATQG